ncbi:BQ5605_C016g08276 [Microbotryum silenes-dioicae]|uniref:Autophagy-related protein n=1 Tax=Microbotryum silenes-dioicae TaxID=796604 RepID=A0A2X0NTD7_9BASI|nr:BQ5605_C016g08276 [Microbotryum silenes-dioicae]
MTSSKVSTHLTPIQRAEVVGVPELPPADGDEAWALLDGSVTTPHPHAELGEPRSTSDGSSNGVYGNKKNSSHRKRLLKGFYAYSIASEVYVTVAGGLFLPVILETYARENGRLGPSYLLPCPPSSQVPSDGDGTTDSTRCAVRLLAHYLDTASFSLYTYSAGVAVQALTVISMGNWADEPRARHRLLVAFATIGTICTMGFLVVPAQSPVWLLCILLAIGANVAFGAGSVCLNSYLPDLGRSSSHVLELHNTLDSARRHLASLRPPSTPGSPRSANRSSSKVPGEVLLSASQAFVRARDEYIQAKALATAAVSSKGIAVGYTSGILALVLALVPIGIGGGSSWGMRMAIAGAGAVWGGGTIPAAIWLRPPKDYTLSEHPPPNIPIRTRVAEGWRALDRMLREWRRLPATFTFLAACFFLSDAGSTITSTAMLFAKTTLGLPTAALIAIAVISPAAGIVGAITVPKVQRRWGWSNLRTLMALAMGMCVIPFWGIVALRTSWQIYPLAFVFGGGSVKMQSSTLKSLYGSLQAFIRTCFSEIIPPSRSAQFFGLLSITDKSSSFLGPMLVAIITNATGQIRYGFVLILVMLVGSLPILRAVDMESGRGDAEGFEREELEWLGEGVGEWD